MSYTPTTWETGDTITAVKLNKIEGACVNANCVFVTATYDSDVMTLPITVREVKTVVESGCMLCVFWDTSDSEEFLYQIEYLRSIYSSDGEYTLTFTGNLNLTADSLDGYPTSGGGK